MMGWFARCPQVRGVGVALGVLSVAQAVPAADAEGKEVVTIRRVSVGDLCGADKQIGRAYAADIRTILKESPRLEIRGDAEGKLDEICSEDARSTAAEVKAAGRALGADRVVVGSYEVRAGLLTLSLRVWDPQAARPLPEHACRVVGRLGESDRLTRILGAQIHRVLTSVDPSEAVPPGSDKATPAGEDADQPTGLIIEAQHLGPRRAMAPRILDEAGRQLYPDPKHLPDMEVLMAKGMASYVRDAGNSPRTGERPLVVRAVAVTGPGLDDLVVSNDTAEQIRRAEERGQFLYRWAVGIVIHQG